MEAHYDATWAAQVQAVVAQFRVNSLLGMGFPKWVIGIGKLRANPEKWFRDAQIDDRDLALINASPVPWITVGSQSLLRHVHHKIKDQPFEHTHCTVENDQDLRGMIAEVGARFTGFVERAHLPARNWEHMMVNVQISGKIAPGVTSGLFSGRASKARVVAGARDTCEVHPWDIMILRDFYANTSNLDDVEYIASRQYDILLMKMCEDWDYPWVVLAAKDSGPLDIPSCSSDPLCDSCRLGF